VLVRSCDTAVFLVKHKAGLACIVFDAQQAMGAEGLLAPRDERDQVPVVQVANDPLDPDHVVLLREGKVLQATAVEVPHLAVAAE